MREGVTLSAGDRDRLEAVVADRNSPQKHVWRARIVLLAGAGLSTAAITRHSGKGKNAVNRWRERFQTAGVDGLLRDKTRPSRIAPLPASVRERTVALTLADPPGEATHWTAAMMAKAAGVSVSSVQRIWRAHGLQPHRVRQFKLSRDPQSAGGYPNIIDISDETSPNIVAKIRLEVSMAANCALMLNDPPDAGGGVIPNYSAERCTVDSQNNPTIAACGWVNAGLRVFDIRDPY